MCACGCVCKLWRQFPKSGSCGYSNDVEIVVTDIATPQTFTLGHSWQSAITQTESEDANLYETSIYFPKEISDTESTAFKVWDTFETNGRVYIVSKVKEDGCFWLLTGIYLQVVTTTGTNDDGVVTIVTLTEGKDTLNSRDKTEVDEPDVVGVVRPVRREFYHLYDRTGEKGLYHVTLQERRKLSPSLNLIKWTEDAVEYIGDIMAIEDPESFERLPRYVVEVKP